MGSITIDREGFLANVFLARKGPCRVATTANITLSGTQTIDGVAVVADDRVLVKDQTDSLNGIYVCKTGEWELAQDFDQRGHVTQGTQVFVISGTTNAVTEWYVTTTGRPVPGRESIAFSRLSAGVSPTTTDNAVARFDGTSGALQDSGVTINDSGQITVSVAGNSARFINTTDSDSVQIARFEGDRATMADSDEAYVSFMLSNDAGTQTEFVRLTWVATDLNAATSEDGALDFGVMTSGTMVDHVRLNTTAFRPITNDSHSIGSANNAWSDLFLASGGAINWDNGDVTLTHGSTNLITVAGGDLAIGAAALSTSAVDGLVYIPSSTSSSTSAPIGTPTGRTGTVPMVYATGNDRLWVYNGTWRSVALSS